MDTGKKVNIGVVGLGYWGPNLVRNFIDVENCRVVMVCDANEARLKPVKKRYPNIELTTKYEDMAASNDVDAIAIATPVISHYPLAKQALENGKHVLIEKPICSNSTEAEDLIKTAKKYQKILMVDHTFLYTGGVRKIKELIDKGEIGQLFYLDSVRINLGLFRPDVNVIWDLASHDISIIHYLFDEPPVSVSAMGRDFNNNNITCLAYITLKYKSGMIAHIHTSWLSPVKIRRIILGGSKKMVIYDDVEPTEKIKIYDSGIEFRQENETSLQPTYRLGDINLPKLDQREALALEANHFIDCILNGKKPLTDGAMGLAVLKILEAADISTREGGREIALNISRQQ